MCGIAGELSLPLNAIPGLRRHLGAMNRLQEHRGPDGEGVWLHERGHVGFGHRRLSIIDLATGSQPMTDGAGNWITYNGEIYNYLELRSEIGVGEFRTTSDTEVILRAYRKWGRDCLQHLRGMFAFAIWDEQRQELFCARDRFGIKPFCYSQSGDTFLFASEAKALLPFVDTIATDMDGLKDYLAFQFCLGGKTLFKGIRELLPGHALVVKSGNIQTWRYWDVYYDLNFETSASAFEELLRERMQDSVRFHMRSDVPVGAYLSGGMDSSAVASMAREAGGAPIAAFHGKFAMGPEFDESRYARDVASERDMELHETSIGVADFIQHIRKVIYHLDYPVAGPGSFPQYMVSGLAARHRKVVLGGQGGDEVFGGYTRYLIAYFEQCIKAAIDGTTGAGKFIVTYESIIPNLTALKNYKPLLQEFWREGLFEDMDKRYFRLINRSNLLQDEIRRDQLGSYSPFEMFRTVFHGDNVRKESYFDLMTHFDFKTLLPALLHVEDRVSMAHGLESRVPLLDAPLVELAATIPSNIKFKDGTMKHVFRNTVAPWLPKSILDRKDKMGFPTPLTEWAQGEARDFVQSVFSSPRAQNRDVIDNRKVLASLDREPRFGRKIWGLLCLELWQQEFHDKQEEFKKAIHEEGVSR